MFKTYGFFAFKCNHHGLQYPFFTAVDGANNTGSRCSKQYARIFFVLKQYLAFFYLVAFLYLHGGAHTDIFLPQQSHLTHRRTGMNGLLRLACNG